VLIAIPITTSTAHARTAREKAADGLRRSTITVRRPQGNVFRGPPRVVELGRTAYDSSIALRRLPRPENSWAWYTDVTDT